MGQKGPVVRYVLVVEDEPILRYNAVDMLEEAGFSVLEASNADEALRLLETRAHEVGALFTDIHMPGSMDGMGLTRTVVERWPHVALLVTSGHARLRDHDIPDAGHFIGKPYRFSDVVKLIGQSIS
jgi:two-component system, response regulator PdtaR